jgi:hypothetical protein
MLVHYIWIGENDIPKEYIFNLENCKNLNPNYTFKVWKDDECIQLLKDNNLFEYWSNLTFICKYNLIKYLILDKFGGVYTDFDIYWNLSFDEIFTQTNFFTHILISVNNYSTTTIDERLVNVIDDPFIVSSKGIFKECIEYCMNRTSLVNDGNIYNETQQLIPHKSEPIGPFGLTEWIYKKNILFTGFTQLGNLDQIGGKFGTHYHQGNWNKFN